MSGLLRKKRIYCTAESVEAGGSKKKLFGIFPLGKTDEFTEKCFSRLNKGNLSREGLHNGEEQNNV
ncbi:hypothetical protein BB776_02930 [Planococcus salinarum]|uniref:Uncharacterized protein n=1 Tax=Planococcus salinarum TaxID=622695 RepID=A0ABX3D0I1_9BACL|nr:hypothetical protein BB776_02930 [Planococcus salinarum]